ncbi:hypothetical protein CLV24_106236 [Pontibacter ummariensis]|uniref:Nucleotide-diphospho-sugar transferase n=1 Tax=Pontibacter ummariensis TaxID=1610492 RepID=A0A239EL62_9BACT|nr:hypothetical protein [Pontibacter ummariensis]PRY13321.1 hypothetical protein CLV24_106236 [Pontibacter ummariensis]SNS45405.1 hypothetical protein SAMN06296052_106236 [Pontibacter ummariensis]
MIDSNQCKVPVLLVTFNRPECTAKVISKIKEIKPEKLFIFSDGPRYNKEGEKELVYKCRTLLDSRIFDWNCEVYTKFSDINLGCGKGVSSAISWAFERVDRLIILEDDCVPDLSFFEFCSKMLSKYEHDERVMHVSGTRWNEEFKVSQTNYFFSIIGHVWGWATWRRAWKQYNYKMQDWNKVQTQKKLLQLFEHRIHAQYWLDNFERIYNSNDTVYGSTWDYQWQYTLFKNNGLAIVPSTNLITNVGTLGAHAQDKKRSEQNNAFHRKTDSWIESLEVESREVSSCVKFDSYHMKSHFMKNTPYLRRLKMFIKSYQ